MLYIMRHGKTDWNLEYRLQGRTNIQLNEMGVEQAKNAAIEYKDIHFDICFVSPLDRAMNTAKLFLEGRDIPIVVDERLVEMGFGEYEGMAHIYQHPELNIYKVFKDPTNYVPDKGAESFEELISRTSAFLNEVALPLVDEGKDVLIVGHGAMNSAIVNTIRGITLEHFWDEGIENCRLIKLI